MPTAAIIVAAGTSRRMGFDKLSVHLLGKPVLRQTVEAFCQAASIDQIYVVCTAERFRLIDEITHTKPVFRVDGGDQRQASVANGLLALPDDITHVAVHDGARPMILPDMIDECMRLARQYGAATLGKRVTETLKRADHEDFVRSSVDRANLWFMETPQCFRKNVLVRAYENVRERGLTVTDEVSALDSIGIATHIVENRESNLKITLPSDLQLAAFLLESRDDSETLS